MPSPKRPFRHILLALAGLALIGGATATSASKGTVYDNIKTYNKILANVYDKYVEDVDSEDLIFSSIDGMMQALDPHSSFLKASDYEDLMLDTQGKYGGIGISIDIRDEWLTVVSPIEGTPAFKLGIRAGDRIVKIEGETTKGITTSQAASKLRGRKGSTVHITIRRQGEPLPLELDIERDVIELKSVPYAAHVRDGVGYVRLTRFSEESTNEVHAGIEKVLSEGAESIVFDLRYNHGGLLTQAVAISNQFLDRGSLIVYTQGRHASDRTEYRATEKPALSKDVPVVVLVNEASASASEIVAGALQDDGRGVILGELTYGKGLVQTLIPLSPDASLKLTTAKWYTPAGRCIQKPWKPDEDEISLADAAADAAGEASDVPVDAAPIGGIQPDVEVEAEPGTRYAFELVRQNHFFRFAVAYSSDQEVPRDFRATPDVVDSFRSYLEEQEFDYETEAQLQIDRLRELGEQDGYDEATLAAIDALEARVKVEKQRDFERNLDYVIFGIEREIQSKVWGIEAAYEVSLRNDKQFDAAVALLKDHDAYLAALEGKEPVKAVASGKGDMTAIAEGDPGYE
ncbi:MAG TPA: S41 family peptidase [bacterium]|nr:S41 family peptidase [bacterium]